MRRTTYVSFVGIVKALFNLVALEYVGNASTKSKRCSCRESNSSACKARQAYSLCTTIREHEGLYEGVVQFCLGHVCLYKANPISQS